MVQHQISRGSSAYTSTYGYDKAGRLVSASVPGHKLTYGFASSGGCGPNTAAGASGDRTSMSDVWTVPGMAAVTTSSVFCYDWAHRLVSSTVTGPVAGAHPVADGLTAAEVGYDARGNTVRLGGAVFGYDGDDQHVSTTASDGSSVLVLRDGAGRMVSQTTTPAGGVASAVRYLYAGGSDVPFGQVTGGVVLCTVGLPGGVTVTRSRTGAGVVMSEWAYPSLLGHTLTTGDGASTAAGVGLFDPFGQRLDPTTLSVARLVGCRWWRRGW